MSNPIPSQPTKNAEIESKRTASRPVSLGDLGTLALLPQNQATLDALCADMLGSPALRQRKRKEAHGLIALAQIAPRLVLHSLDLRTEILAVVELRDTPIPCKPPGASDIEIADRALLAIRYPEALVLGPIPGTLPVRVLEPRHVFHSNVAYGVPAPALCLGAHVPRGFPLREIVLTAYGALTLQAISLDALDPAGVLNPEAALWYQANAARVPLTTAAFLDGRDVGSDDGRDVDHTGERS